MTEAKKALFFFLAKKPYYSISGAKRLLAQCLGGGLGKQISLTVVLRAQVPKGNRIPQALLPNAETQNKILQVIAEVNSVYTLDIEKILAFGIIS